MVKRKILSKKITDYGTREANVSSPISPKRRYKLIPFFFILFLAAAWLVYTGTYLALFDKDRIDNIRGIAQNKEDMATASRAFVLGSTSKTTGLVCYVTSQVSLSQVNFLNMFSF